MRGKDPMRMLCFVLQSIFEYKENIGIHQAPIRLARQQRVDFIEAASGGVCFIRSGSAPPVANSG